MDANTSNFQAWTYSFCEELFDSKGEKADPVPSWIRFFPREFNSYL